MSIIFVNENVLLSVSGRRRRRGCWIHIRVGGVVEADGMLEKRTDAATFADTAEPGPVVVVSSLKAANLTVVDEALELRRSSSQL